MQAEIMRMFLAYDLLL